jgi:hypothetical protein
MGINPTIQLAKTISDQDALQNAIADLQRRMDAVILGESNEDETGLRLELSRLKALLGENRNEEAFWKAEIEAGKEARKSQADLGRG